MDNVPIVIDNGTGFTKMGYSGNLDPDFVIPTAIAELQYSSSTVVSSAKNDDYNYYIGNKGIEISKTSNKHQLIYPMQNGMINDWDVMEKFWHQSLYQYLKCDPTQHVIVLTEPPMNPPENREQIAEIFFETFNVSGLYIGVQAVFALVGCKRTFEDVINGKQKEQKEKGKIDDAQLNSLNKLTGVVVDSGDGVTHVVPVCDGYSLGGSIKHVPIAGRKITKFMEQMIRERGEKMNTEDLYYAVMDLKEKYGYVCRDIIEELNKYDNKTLDDRTSTWLQSSKFKKFEGFGKISGKPFSIDLGYELFMGPEAFFSPEIIDKNYRQSLDEIIDTCIQQSPIDYRRDLYANVVFSGGSTNFRNLDKRLELELQKRIDRRLKKNTSETFKPKPIKCNVTNSMSQKYVVWVGGSTFSCLGNFRTMYHTRAQYEEMGAACCRFNGVFGF